MYSVLAMTLFQGVLVAVSLLLCLLLIVVVLLQKGRGGGLAGAFGGAGGGGGAFGAKTGDVFTVVTVVLALVFLMLNVVGNWILLPEEVEPQAQAEVTGAPGAPVLPEGAIPPPGTTPTVPPATGTGTGERVTPPAVPATPAEDVDDGGEAAEPGPSTPDAEPE
jgi:preprotein translocase subunit SecG